MLQRRLVGMTETNSESPQGRAPSDAWISEGSGPADQNLPAMLDPVEIVTGDAVLLDMRPATVATRGAAITIDALLLSLGTVLFSFLIFRWTPIDYQIASIIALLVSPVYFVILPVVIEAMSGGRSPGKFVLGLRVVRDDAGPIRMRQSLVRALAGVMELYSTFGAIAFFASLANAQGKRLGDMLAGTMVIGDRARRVTRWEPEMPPHLQTWAVTADLDRVPDTLEHSMRSLLSRQDMIATESWDRVAGPVMEQVSTHVFPPPPPGVSYRDVMQAVVAERYRRDVERLTQREDAGASMRERIRAVPFSSVATTRATREPTDATKPPSV